MMCKATGMTGDYQDITSALPGKDRFRFGGDPPAGRLAEAELRPWLGVDRCALA